MAKYLKRDGVVIAKSSETYQLLDAIKTANKADDGRYAKTEAGKLHITGLQTRIAAIDKKTKEDFEVHFPNFVPYRVGDHLSEVWIALARHGQGAEGFTDNHESKIEG